MTPTDEREYRPHSHPALLNEREFIRECRLEQTRRSGPGGQHRNKVSTAIVLIHEPSNISAEASERRSQADNRRVAIRRLREELAIRVRSSRDFDQHTKQTTADLLGASDPRTAGDLRSAYGGPRLRLSESNEDRPAVLAVMLDDLESHAWELSRVAELWKTSNSQLIRFLKLWPAAFEMLNHQRAAMGLRELK